MDMTKEEKQLISDCIVTIKGTESFNSYIADFLHKLCFIKIRIEPEEEKNFSIIKVKDRNIYSFDFVDGAGAVVVIPENETELIKQSDLRQWMAEYIIGYCAFWNVEGYEWIQQVLPEIKEGIFNIHSCKTAACICARIAGNIAVNRHVKQFPLFYLCKNLK